jgi:hypothetical protein
MLWLDLAELPVALLLGIVTYTTNMAIRLTYQEPDLWMQLVETAVFVTLGTIYVRMFVTSNEIVAAPRHPMRRLVRWMRRRFDARHTRWTVLVNADQAFREHIIRRLSYTRNGGYAFIRGGVTVYAFISWVIACHLLLTQPATWDVQADHFPTRAILAAIVGLTSVCTGVLAACGWEPLWFVWKRAPHLWRVTSRVDVWLVATALSGAVAALITGSTIALRSVVLDDPLIIVVFLAVILLALVVFTALLLWTVYRTLGRITHLIRILLDRRCIERLGFRDAMTSTDIYAICLSLRTDEARAEYLQLLRNRRVDLQGDFSLAPPELLANAAVADELAKLQQMWLGLD